jgi:hypothetical protein
MFYYFIGDDMKKFYPYILSLLIGSIFGFLLFKNAGNDISSVFSETLNCTGFELGVFNKKDAATELTEKYPPSIVIKDNDVYRVYYSVLTNKNVIKKMEDYLNNNKISFYSKEITITDESLIKALNKYESSMIEGNDSVLTSLNKLIMNSYGGKNENQGTTK